MRGPAVRLPRWRARGRSRRGGLCWAAAGAWVLIALTSCGERRAESYVAALSDPNPGVRRQASYELVVLGRVAVEPLVAHAANGSDSLQYVSAIKS